MHNRTLEGRRVWFAAILLAAVVFFPGAAAGQEPPASAAQQRAEKAALDERFTRPVENAALPETPEAPVEALISATNAHSARLGYPVNHGPAIRASGLSPELAGRAALLMHAVLSCPAVNRDAPRVTGERLDCAAAVNRAAAGISRLDRQTSGDIQAWPALYIDGDGRGDYHRYDYSVLVDTGGNDTYDNNAGGNLLDNYHGPRGSAAPSNRRAVGCEHPHISPGVPGTIADPFDCIADRQTVLIDQRGHDKYGVFEEPTRRDADNGLPVEEPPLDRRLDGDCTNDKLIRRIMTQGAALQGNALLMDGAGNDKYRGKTGSQGTGHVGGIGILRDLGGDDDYLAIRNSQGFSLVSGIGLLQDEGGDDRYHTYMPRPKNLKNPAPLNEPGAGGVVDDTDQCDRIPRMVQGAGISFGSPGGMGRLLDDNGRDTYIGDPPVEQLFLPKDSPASVFTFRHSSQGFGCDGSVGKLEDKGRDEDVYRRGPRGRRDGAEITDPNLKCGTFGPGLGIFKDDGPGRQ